jgi:hypothetical protein
MPSLRPRDRNARADQDGRRGVSPDGCRQPAAELAVSVNATAESKPERMPTPYEASMPPAVRRWLALTPRAPSLEVLITLALSRPP